MCLYYLVRVKDSNSECLSFHSVLMINEFSKVFLHDLPSVSLDRKIEFGIDFVLDTRPLSIPPYRITPVELKALKEKLKDLFDKDFIEPSISPWGTPILFMHKKDGFL